jgi:protein-disulfide isomerase
MEKKMLDREIFGEHKSEDKKRGNNGLTTKSSLKKRVKGEFKLTTFNVILIALVVSLSLILFMNLEKITGANQQNQGSNQVAQGGQRGQVWQDNNFASNTGLTIEQLIDDDYVLGNKNAEVIVVEFSDYQCPFCRRFYLNTIKQLKKDYIDTGKVAFVYRDFPLEFHPMAQKTAEAAQCAGEQGKYYEYHDKVFEEQAKMGQGTIPYSIDDLKRWANEIGLDMQKFNDCLNNEKYKDEVQKDFYDGIVANVEGTPTIFIGKRGKPAKKIVGALPYEVIKAAIEQTLKE